jgi:hypothetical protein
VVRRVSSSEVRRARRQLAYVQSNAPRMVRAPTTIVSPLEVELG